MAIEDDLFEVLKVGIVNEGAQVSPSWRWDCIQSLEKWKHKDNQDHITLSQHCYNHDKCLSECHSNQCGKKSEVKSKMPSMLVRLFALGKTKKCTQCRGDCDVVLAKKAKTVMKDNRWWSKQYYAAALIHWTVGLTPNGGLAYTYEPSVKG